MAWREPTNPVGTYNPCYMSNMYGASWSSAWSTAIHGNPMQTGADVLSNCVGYTQGRMLELWLLDHPGYDPAQTRTHPFIDFNVQAGDDWFLVADDLGYEFIDEPEPCCVLITPTHVAVVETEIEGEWWVSESGYNDPTPWYYHTSLYKSGGTWYDSYGEDPEIFAFFKIPDVSPTPYPGARLGYDRRRRYRNI